MAIFNSSIRFALLAAILVLPVLLTGCSNKAANQNQPRASNDVSSQNWMVSDFSYTDLDDKKFSLADLKSKPTLVDFSFAGCPNICQPMTANMSKVQKHLKKENVDFQIVAFSVDPENESAQTRLNFLKKYDADLSNWHFLGGYTFKEIQDFCKKNFKEEVSSAGKGLINHSSRFFLVDTSGKIVRFYNGLDPDVEQIARDIKSLDKS